MSRYHQDSYSNERYSHYRAKDYGSRNYRSRDFYSSRERQPIAKSKVMGVCAGIARQFGWDVTLVRLVAILCLFTFTLPTFFAYIIAGALFY